MKIGGLLNFSIIDYPGKVAAVVFTQGCNFRCPYCHNSELVVPEKYNSLVEEKKIFDLLYKRKGKLEAVVISGGEPTIQKNISEFMKKIKDLGYLIKLDTNGTMPEILNELIQNQLVNYVAMDIKGPLKKYDVVSGVKVDLKSIRQSINIIINSKIDYEFRTTLVKPFISKSDVAEILSLIKNSKKYVIQQFIPRASVIDENFRNENIDNYSEEEIIDIEDKIIKKFF